MRTAKRFMILSLTAAMAAALVSCGDKAKAEVGSAVGSNAVVSADTGSEVSAWDTLTDKEKDFYNELEKKGHTIKKDTGYVYIGAAGYADEWGNTFGDEGIVISYYFGSDEVVHVPEEIDGKKVVNVAGPPMWKFGDTNDDHNDDNYYLDYMFNIRELYFPEDLQEIKGAFNACETLEKIELPKSQTEIGFCCFRLCTGLKEFTCPEGLTVINESAFSDCKSMTSITFNDGLKTIGTDAFSGCESLEKLEFPDTLESIGPQSFQMCKGLKEVNIPPKVDNIPKRAFMYCESLETLELPESVTAIGSKAFAHCSSLKEIYIPETVSEIAETAFEDCDSLTIKGKAGSYAEKYARINEIGFAAKG